jgi:hypothetical protein
MGAGKINSSKDAVRVQKTMDVAGAVGESSDDVPGIG